MIHSRCCYSFWQCPAQQHEIESDALEGVHARPSPATRYGRRSACGLEQCREPRGFNGSHDRQRSHKRSRKTRAGAASTAPSCAAGGAGQARALLEVGSRYLARAAGLNQKQATGVTLQRHAVTASQGPIRAPQRSSWRQRTLPVLLLAAMRAGSAQPRTAADTGALLGRPSGRVRRPKATQ